MANSGKRNQSGETPSSARQRGKIFISYRRVDSIDLTGRIHDWLTKRIPAGDVFRDVDNIEYGADFIRRIEQEIQQCKTMLVVIGPTWFNSDGTLSPQINKEIELALRYGLRIIPVLVNGAKVPSAQQLPANINALSSRNGVDIRSDYFARDMQWLGAQLGIRRGARSNWAVSVLLPVSVVFIVIALCGGVLSAWPEGNPVWLLFHPSTAPTPTLCSKAFSGEFGDILDGHWMWVDPDKNSSHRVLNRSGANWLTIGTVSGHDLFPGNMRAPRVLQPLDGDFSIETQVDFDPPAAYQGAGLLVWQDENNFLRLERAYGDTQGIEFDKMQKGVYSRITLTRQAPFNGSPMSLLLQRKGDHFTASWNSGVNWDTIGETDQPFASNVQVGLAVVNASPYPITAAYFKGFTVSCG